MMNQGSCVPSLASLGVVAAILPGASAFSEVSPLIASATVASFMLLFLIAMIVFSLSADSWIRSSMKKRGKVKRSVSYLQKKRRAQEQLLAASRRQSAPSTQAPTIPPQSIYTEAMPPPMDKHTMVQGWNTETQKIYEEKGYALDLGEENETEFQIETTLVDNEVLDVGPFKKMSTRGADAVEGNVYAKPYIYSNNDQGVISHSTRSTGGVVSAVRTEQDVLASTRGDEPLDTTLQDHVISM